MCPCHVNDQWASSFDILTCDPGQCAPNLMPHINSYIILLPKVSGTKFKKKLLFKILWKENLRREHCITLQNEYENSGFINKTSGL